MRERLKLGEIPDDKQVSKAKGSDSSILGEEQLVDIPEEKNLHLLEQAIREKAFMKKCDDKIMPFINNVVLKQFTDPDSTTVVKEMTDEDSDGELVRLYQYTITNEKDERKFAFWVNFETGRVTPSKESINSSFFDINFMESMEYIFGLKKPEENGSVSKKSDKSYIEPNFL